MTTMDYALGVKERVGATLMRLPGVVGVGVGRTANGTPCLVLYLDGAGVAAEALPWEIDQVPVVAAVVGRVEAI
jgi:hypothetical protein